MFLLIAILLTALYQASILNISFYAGSYPQYDNLLCIRILNLKWEIANDDYLCTAFQFNFLLSNVAGTANQSKIGHAVGG